MRVIKVTNTLTGKKEVFETHEPGKLTMYSCGPTVYGLIHIGNLRAALVSDMLFKYFKKTGYQVNYVRNYTDVDDKIIKKAVEEGISSEELALKYTREVEKDFTEAGIVDPTHKTTVTTHIPEIISLIEKIIQNKKAYVAPDGEVIFSIDSFPEYGKLSKKPLEDLVAGSRVEVSTKKRNPLDFTLWKPAKPGEPSWESPWGKGRPGWHIECSAMSSKWLGDQIDLHHGGEDLVFPHHENEIAQSEAASGKAPFVKYWLHHAFLTMSKEKMSKSLGNVLNARDFLSKFGGEFARYMLLSTHYRSVIDFCDDSVEQTLTALTRIYEAKQKAIELLKTYGKALDSQSESQWGGFLASCEQARRQIDEAYANDFNSAEALAALFTLIRELNRLSADPRIKGSPSAILGGREFLKVLEEEIGSVIGVGLKDPTEALAKLEQIRASRPIEGGVKRPEAAEVEKLIAERIEAKKSKNFARADEIRKDLDARGVLLKDAPGGVTTWNFK